MSSEARRVKLLTLVELVLGLALGVVAVVMLILGPVNPTPYYLACGEGAIAFVFGVRGALIANVPARIGKLVSFGAIVLLLQVICVAGMVYTVGTDKVDTVLPAVIPGAVLVLVTLCAVLLSRGIARRAER